MAKLTKEQKVQLAQIVKDLFESETLERNHFYKGCEIKNMLNKPYCDYATISIVNAIGGLGQELCCNKYDENQHCNVYAKMNLNKTYIVPRGFKFTKDKNIINITCENGKILKYDFNTHEFIIDDDESILNKYPQHNHWGIPYHSLYEALANYGTRMKEWVFSYPELWSEYSYYDSTRTPPMIDFDVPKGYIQYLKDMNETINNKTYQAFQLAIKINNARASQNLINDFSNHDLLDFFNTITYKDFQKMITNQIKECDISSLKYDINKFISLVYELKRDEEIVIDTNRSIKYNNQELENLKHKKENLILSNQLKRLNFLNGKTIGDYQIIVPQTIEDLQNEGHQQNNCVGHYYNSSICAGQNLIYFLRHTDAPTKSVITCRYHLLDKETVEHRIKNNRSTTKEQKDLIKQIDIIIRQNLDQ